MDDPTVAVLPRRTRDGTLVRQTSAAVLLWAAIGAVSTAIGVTAWIRWIASSDLTATAVGTDLFPDWRIALLRLAEVASSAVALFVVWRCVVSPLLRTHRLPFDGAFVIGSALMWWMDPLVNFYNFSFAYNAHLINLGSWTRFIPGWQAPNQHLFPEPIFLIGAAYVWWPIGIAALGCAVCRRIQRHRPDASVLRLLTAVFLTNAALYLLGEQVFIRVLKVLVFPGVPEGFGLFPGSLHQFPLSEPIGMGCFGIILAALRFFRDDQGHSFAEHGVARMPLGSRAKRALSLLAVIGAVHSALLAYYVVYLPFTLRAGTAPVLPSYFRVGICGTGTDYACPSRAHVPIPSRSSLHIAPDDPRLPQSVRVRPRGSAN